jgi:hypothetical protein
LDEVVEELVVKSKKEKIMARPTAPNAVPTPLKKQEPTTQDWKQSGTTSVTDAISHDKNDVRKPVQTGDK